MVLQITRFIREIQVEGEAVVITEIAKKNKLIIPKWLVHQTLGKVRYVWIEKTKEGLEISKVE